MISKNVERDSENGSALVIILITIALFVALSMAYSRMGGGNDKLMSDGQISLAASEILDYAKDIERTVDRLIANGCSEEDISFVNSTVAGYIHAPVAPDSCKIFNSSGGGLTWKSPPDGVNDGSEIVFTGNNRSSGIGTGIADLVMVLPNITEDICSSINNYLGFGTSIPTDPDYLSILFKYTGSLSFGAQIDGGEYTNCIQTTSTGGGTTGGNYYFIAVLIAR